ncbi:15915_t:CDS:2 [Funneliformis mosseae]|uniref:15915_t:CDS:1 n=1 Tax=Funneliformis mosseae TaxID=27381 RepID=A0A9N8YY26_FUNMO|nr:15915_t:CDS:2 [Funneliformis mosseae]
MSENNNKGKITKTFRNLFARNKRKDDIEENDELDGKSKTYLPEIKTTVPVPDEIGKDKTYLPERKKLAEISKDKIYLPEEKKKLFTLEEIGMF